MSVKVDKKICLRVSARLLRQGLLLAAVCLLWRRSGVMGQAATPSLTQRKINEMAATLERARLALIEDTGLRQAQEPLPIYLNRLVLPQSGEARVAYNARIEGYLKALGRTIAATAPARHAIDPRHADAANRQCWQRATQALNLLPLRMDKLQRAWREAKERDRTTGTVELGPELTQTLGLVIAAYSALRDARP
jgi:hypothetical protein